MKNMIEANLSSSEQPGTNKPVPMKKTTMSVPEMRELLGLKKTESYWLVHRGFFKTKIIGGQMRVDLESFEEWYRNQVKHKKIIVAAISSSNFSLLITISPFIPRI